MDFAQILAIVVAAILLVQRAGFVWTVQSVCVRKRPASASARVVNWCSVWTLDVLQHGLLRRHAGLQIVNLLELD
jgi:hypothetical protein